MAAGQRRVALAHPEELRPVQPVSATLRPERQPKLLVVGGSDLHRRIDFLLRLAERFEVSAAGSDRRLRPHFTDAGLDYHYYPASRGLSPVGDLVSIVRLTSLVRRLRPDIVHAFGTKSSLWGRFAARLGGAPVVIGTLTGLGSLYVSGGPLRRLLRAGYGSLQWICCRISDLTILQHVDDADQLQKAGIAPSHKTTVVPGSGVRTDQFDPSRVAEDARLAIRHEMGAEADSVVVTMVSRLIRSKGVMEFAAAAKLAGECCRNAVFVLVGPDDQESVDRLSSPELAELRKSVCWLGERRDIMDILGASDVFVLPSYYREGIPRVLLEAAAMGLPLISTRSPGCQEVVLDEINGFLVEPRDSAQLAAAMERLIQDPHLRLRFGSTSRSRCVEAFDLSVVAAQTESLYLRLLKDRHLPT